MHIMTEANCPNCADRVPTDIANAVMLTCPSCATTLYLDGARLSHAGTAGEMLDAPMLFDVGDQVTLGSHRLDILGHARFSYGRGWWDEFWVEDSDGRGAWISVDEGDIVLQFPIPAEHWPAVPKGIRVGSGFLASGRNFVVTERDRGECVALRGVFGEALEVGETYTYLNATGDDGSLLSGEFWDGGQAWSLGTWFDPFETQVSVLAGRASDWEPSRTGVSHDTNPPPPATNTPPPPPGDQSPSAPWGGASTDDEVKSTRPGSGSGASGPWGKR